MNNNNIVLTLKLDIGYNVGASCFQMNSNKNDYSFFGENYVDNIKLNATCILRLCFTICGRGDTICPRPSPPPVGAQAPRAPPSRRKVAVLSHVEYVPTLTAAAALRVKAALSKAAW